MHVNVNARDDEAGYPIRILQDAIAKGVPNKDLLITPEHCLFFEDKFVPARMLVNGRSIFYDRSITTYDYYHIETEDHSIIMADGVLTESYLDTGNRRAFLSEQKVVPLQGKTWEDDAAAPLMVQRPIVEPIYRQLEGRAQQMNVVRQTDMIETTDDAGIYIITDKGQSIHNYWIEDGRVAYSLPHDTQSIRIMTRVGRPSDTIGAFIDDRRYLGVLIGQIVISSNDQDGKLVTQHLEETKLEGWDIKETVPCRWTKGNAFVKLDNNIGNKKDIKLTIQVLGGGPYYLENMDEFAETKTA